MSDILPDRQFQAFLAEGRFMIQRGVKSGRHVFYPRIAEPGTGDELEWVEASGYGTVYAVTEISRKPPEPPYNVVLIDLDESPRMMSRVVGLPPGGVAIGMRVRARIVEENGAPLVVFEKA